MVIYVDIDETICEYNEDREYPKATPIKNNIKKINSLYDEGNTIIYWTARGSTTGTDWTDLTVKQLKLWEVKYTDLKLGKPHYDLFICDKAINTLTFFKEEK